MTSRGCFKIHMLPTILALKQCGKYRGTLKLWSSEPVQVCSRKDPASRPSSRCWGTGWCWQCSVLLLTSTPQLWSSLPTPLHFTARNLEILFGNILCNMEWLTRLSQRQRKAQVPCLYQQERRKAKYCVSTPTQSSEHSLNIMLHNQILTPPPSGKMSTTTLLKPFSTQPLLSCAAKPLTLCLTQQSSRGTLSHKLAGLVSTVICSDNKVTEPVRVQQ